MHHIKSKLIKFLYKISVTNNRVTSFVESISKKPAINYLGLVLESKLTSAPWILSILPKDIIGGKKMSHTKKNLSAWRYSLCDYKASYICNTHTYSIFVNFFEIFCDCCLGCHLLWGLCNPAIWLLVIYQKKLEDNPRQNLDKYSEPFILICMRFIRSCSLFPHKLKVIFLSGVLNTLTT